MSDEEKKEKPQIIVVNASKNHSHGVAAVLSLVIPGAGQMYKGQIINGLVWLVVVVIGYMALIVPGLILHIMCIIGAASGESKEQTILVVDGKVSHQPPTAKNGLTIGKILIGGILLAFIYFHGSKPSQQTSSVSTQSEPQTSGISSSETTSNAVSAHCKVVAKWAAMVTVYCPRETTAEGIAAYLKSKVPQLLNKDFNQVHIHVFNNEKLVPRNIKAFNAISEKEFYKTKSAQLSINNNSNFIDFWCIKAAGKLTKCLDLYNK